MTAIMDQAVGKPWPWPGPQGIRLVFPAPAAHTRQVARATADNIASMLQDIRAQRPTEIDQISGAISLWGRRFGIPTPVNDTLAGLVRTLQNSYGSASDPHVRHPQPPPAGVRGHGAGPSARQNPVC
jgi:2-dehydropantoate 2-reductase